MAEGRASVGAKHALVPGGVWSVGSYGRSARVEFSSIGLDLEVAL